MEAIKCGEIDTSIFPEDISDPRHMNQEQLSRELARLDLFEDKEIMLQRSELMRKLAKGEIYSGTYIEEMAKIGMQESNNV